jgi:hypothetical protein
MWVDRFMTAHGFRIERLASEYGEIWVVFDGKKRWAATPETIALWRTLVEFQAPPDEARHLLTEFENRPEHSEV